MTSYPPTAPAGAGLHCMVGFIAGEAARAAGAMRQSEVVRKALDQLDAMFREAVVAFREPYTLTSLHSCLTNRCSSPSLWRSPSCPCNVQDKTAHVHDI